MTIDLINGKEMFCPECGRKLEPQGRVNGNKAKVMAYCPNCRIDYVWNSCVDENGDIVIENFEQYKTTCNNETCENSKNCPYFTKT